MHQRSTEQLCKPILKNFETTAPWANRLAGIRPVLLFLAFFVLSLNMRAALTSLPPIIHDIRETFSISAGVAGALTSIPVFCFGFLSPAAGLLIKRLGVEGSVFATLAGVLAGTILRSAGGAGFAFAGTLVIGIALTIGNIAALMVIGRDFPRHTNAMTGIYVSGISIGSMVTTALTAPVAHAAGWRTALAIPGIFALAAIILWAAVQSVNKITGHVPADITTPNQASSKDNSTTFHNSHSFRRVPMRVVCLLSVAFAAHTFLFYGLTAWLPAYMIQTEGMDVPTAGLAASLFQILGLLGCLGLPALASTRRFSNRFLFLIVTLSWIFTAAGFWAAPSLWIIWTIFGGIGSGGGFTVIFGLVMDYARDIDENRKISTIVQSVGYMVASLSPFVIGHLHELTGQWDYCMALLSVAGVVMTLCGMGAAKKAG